MEIRTPNSDLEWQSYYQLRFEVLRKPWGQLEGSEKDHLEAHANHFACFDGDSIVGVGRLDALENHGFQIRFMAVDPNHQGKGIGSDLMVAMEKAAWNGGGEVIYLHAREVALDFYRNLGYRYLEVSHLLFGSIQHHKMKKEKGEQAPLLNPNHQPNL